MGKQPIYVFGTAMHIKTSPSGKIGLMRRNPRADNPSKRQKMIHVALAEAAYNSYGLSGTELKANVGAAVQRAAEATRADSLAYANKLRTLAHEAAKSNIQAMKQEIALAA